MEETEVEETVVEKMEKSFPWEEWTVIEDGDNAKNHKTSQENHGNEVSSSELSYSDIENTSDAEEARENSRTLDTCLSDSVSRQNEESDGVSVISESETEEQIVNENANNKIVLYETVSHRSEESNQENNNNEVARCVYLLIACSMVIAIGTGLASTSYFQNNKISNDADYMTIKMENDRLLERMKEFTNVKGILEEIKTSIMQEKNLEAAEIPNSQITYLNEHMNRLDSIINEPKTTLTERLQIFLTTICLVLEDIRQNDKITPHRKLCDKRTYFDELSNIRTLLTSVNEEIDDDTMRTSNKRFLENIDIQITSMNDRLVTDLTRVLDKLNLKNQRKMEKIVNKMKEKLCILRNTLPSESKIRKSLGMHDTFGGNCKKIVSKKFDSREKEKWHKEEAKMTENFEKKDLKITQPNSAERLKVARERNSTKSYNRPNDYQQQNVWETRKCYRDNLSDFVVIDDQENSENTCSLLVAPPRSSMRKSTKFQTFSQLRDPMDSAKNDETFGRKKVAKKRFDKQRLKGDEVASKYSKKNTLREHDETKNRKRIFSSNEKNNGYEKRRMTIKESPRSSFIETSNINSDFEYKRANPVKSTLQDRVKKRFAKVTTNELDRRETDENIRDNGEWQFARSQIRDELRKDKSIDNWYFERVSNRKNSRMSVDDNIEKQR